MRSMNEGRQDLCIPAHTKEHKITVATPCPEDSILYHTFPSSSSYTFPALSPVL